MRLITAALVLSLPLVALSASTGHQLRRPALRHRAAAAYVASNPQGAALARALVERSDPAGDAAEASVGNQTGAGAARRQTAAENSSFKQKSGDGSNPADGGNASVCVVTLSPQSGTQTTTTTFTADGQGAAADAGPPVVKRSLSLREERALAARQAAEWIADVARSCLDAAAADLTIRSGVVACSSIGYLDAQAGEFGSHLSVFRIGAPPPAGAPRAAQLEFIAPCGELRRTAPGALDLLQPFGSDAGALDATNPQYHGFVGDAEAVLLGSFHMNEPVPESGPFAPTGFRWAGRGAGGVGLRHLDLTGAAAAAGVVEGRRWGMFDRHFIPPSGSWGKRAGGAEASLALGVLADGGCRVTDGFAANPFFTSSDAGSGNGGGGTANGNNGGGQNGGGSNNAGTGSIASTSQPASITSTKATTKTEASTTTANATTAASNAQAPAAAATPPTKDNGGKDGSTGSDGAGGDAGAGADPTTPADAPQSSGVGGNLVSTGMIQATAANAVAAAAAVASTTVAAAAAESASASTFQLPGRNLQVLPIGLGIFAGVSVLALTVVGVVTYERRKYRNQYRERKTREQVSQAGGFGRMSEARV